MVLEELNRGTGWLASSLCRCVKRLSGRLSCPKSRNVRPRSGVLGDSVISLALACAVLGSCVMLYGQVGTARIRGLVLDPSGAPVPGAVIVLTNTQTSTTYKAQSNSDGQFSFDYLPIGTYSLTAEAKGFKRHIQSGIILVGDQDLTVNALLQIGAVTQQVTVRSPAATVDTQNGTLRQTISRQQIVDLPLNGRNPLELVALSAGTFETGGGSNDQSSTLPGESFFSVNGGRTNSVNFLLNGNDSNDPYTNVAAPVPEPDALAEFSVQTSNFSAAYGRSSGAIVNAITKSGTNQFHGSAFEFLRNGDADARNFFSTTQDTLDRNQFGGTLGGPVIIPHLYNGRDKTWFFGSYQGTREHSASSSGFLVLPTAAEAAGDFSSLTTPVIDPATGQQFPGNVIPTSDIDSYATKTLGLIYPTLSSPTPGAPSSTLQTVNEHFVLPNRNLTDQFLVRIDQNLSNTEHLTLSNFYWRYNKPVVASPAGLYPASTEGLYGFNDNAEATLTSSLSPRLVNLLTAGFNRVYSDQTLPPYVSSRQIGLDVFSQPPDPMTLSISGLSGVSFQPPVPNTRNTFTVQDAATLSFGRHMIKWGGEVQRIQQLWTFNNDFPNYDFNGFYTGVGLADFLLGKPFYLYEGGYQAMNTRFTGWNLYTEDSYKVNRKLTVDLGVRWEPWIAPHYVGVNKIAEFSPADAAAGIHSIIYDNAPPGILYYGDPGVPKGGANSDWKDFAPRVGFAYDFRGNGKTVFRGGYGIFYDEPKDDMWNHANDNPPFGGVAYLQAGINAPYSYEDPFNGKPNPVESIFNPNPLSPFPGTPINGLFYFSSFHMPNVQQWNATLQEVLPGGLLAHASYVGSHGTHLIWVRDADPPVWTTNNTQSNIQQRRPYNPILGYTNTPFFDSYSNYNALQVGLTRRFSKGLALTANYTYEKAMDLNSDSVETIYFNPVDPYNLRLDYGPSDFNLPQNFIASLVWQLPVPKMQNRFLNGALRGWQINGIFSARSGPPFTIYSYQSIFPTGLNFQRPIQVLPDAYLNRTGPTSARISGYLNPAAFANPNPSLPYPQIYNDVVGRNSLYAPGYKDADVSLFRTLNIEERFQVQLRAEAFNVFNSVNLGGPSPYFVDSQFGKITSAGSPRILQAGVRITF